MHEVSITQCLRCGYDLRELPKGKCPECGREFDPADARSYRGAAVHATPKQARLARRIVLGINLVSLGVAIVISAGAYDPTLLVVGAIVWLAIMGFIGSTWLLMEWDAYRRLHCRHCAAEVVTTLLLASIVWFQWPLRVNFLLHARGLDALADRMQAGDPPPLPRRVGLFVIKEADWDNYDDTVGLYFDLNPNGYAGFYRTAAPVDSPPANEWSWARLNDLWWMIYED